MKYISTLFFFIFLTLNLSAQRNCFSMENLEIQIQQDPGIIDRMQAIEKQTAKFIKEYNQDEKAAAITIPVVVHVVYKQNSQNISTAQVMSQIDILNEDFRRTNSDRDNEWSQAADTNIEFCLATVDPDGNATNGITRTKTRKQSFNGDAVKSTNSGGKDAWPSGDYLNIWVCNLGQGLLGYAQFPGGNPATDGVVIDYQAYGNIGTASAPFDLGRTGTHEVGHWLNLRHIWGDGNCSFDDFVADTPLSDAPNYGCALGHVSCSSLDMVQNYMDYSDDACMNLFTSGQSTRMSAVYSTGGPRESLNSSNGCGTPGNGSTCDDEIMNGQETGVDCGGPDCPPCSTGTCLAPSNLFASQIKAKKARVNWDGVNGALSYDVEYRANGTGNWSVTNTTSTNKNLGGLASNTTYFWRVKTLCSGNESDYSQECSFTTGNAGSGACNNARISNSELDFNVFPNPANDLIKIDLGQAMGERTDLMIYNPFGKLMLKKSINGELGIEINIDDLPSGVYLIKIESQNGSSGLKKLIKHN